MTTTNRLIIGMISAAAGVIIGMLVTPENGPDLRRKIKDNAGNWANKIVDLLGSGKDDLADTLNDARSNATNALS